MALGFVAGNYAASRPNKRRPARAERLYFCLGNYGVTVNVNVSAGEAVIGDDPVVLAFTVTV